MDFLKQILGEELFKQISEKINAHNGDEANKDNLVKLANLAKGEYVSVNKYNDLQTLLNGKTGELETANNLIADLKKSNKGNEDLQTKITGYEGQIQQLQKELQLQQVESAIKVALLEAKATDIDYMTFKLKEKGEVKLDKNGKIENWESTLDGLKTQFPNQFESSQKKTVTEIKLDPRKDEKDEPTSLAEAIKQSYQN